MITAIFFDIDGTLLDFKAAEKAAFCRSMGEFGIDHAEEKYPRYTAFNRSLWEALERGELTRDELLAHRYENFFKNEGIRRDPRAFEDSYRKNLTEEHILMDGALEILDYLYGKYPMYVVTNGIAHTQYRRMKDSGIDRYFDGIFISEEVGYSKPDPRFFEKALEGAGNPDPADVIIIGDSLTSDIKGGIHAGLKTCWLHEKDAEKKEDYPTDYDIVHLSELKEIL